MSTTVKVNLSSRLKNLLFVTPSKFQRLLNSKKPTKVVSFATGVSVRTIQELRQQIRETQTAYTSNGTTY